MRPWRLRVDLGLASVGEGLWGRDFPTWVPFDRLDGEGKRVGGFVRWEDGERRGRRTLSERRGEVRFLWRWRAEEEDSKEDGSAPGQIRDEQDSKKRRAETTRRLSRADLSNETPAFLPLLPRSKETMLRIEESHVVGRPSDRH